MARFNARTPTLKVADTVNLAGGEAYSLDARTELVTILLTSMAKDQTYRSGDETIDRLRELIGQVDPEFAAKAAVFARDEFGMRSISHVAAAELAKFVKGSGETWPRRFYDKIVVRADDITEILSLYLADNSKTIPNPMRKGLSDAFGRMDAYKLAKYRGEGRGVSLVDAVRLIHPQVTAKNAAGLKGLVDGTLRNTETWEAKMSAASGETEKTAVWQELIDNGRMPYFALLRNLRNIEQTGDDNLIRLAAEQLVQDDPGSHRVLPFRFLTAYGEVTNPRLKKAISDALDRAVVNVPDLPGKTLIVIDHSGSMGYSTPGTPRFIADTFAAIVVKANPDADIMIFGTDAGTLMGINPADSVLTNAALLGSVEPPGGHSTNFHAIYNRADKAYDRFMIFSDMQAWVGYRTPVDAMKEYERRTGSKPFNYAFDLAGYGTTQFSRTGRNVQLAGFSEKIFDTVKVIESDPLALIKRIEAVEL